MDELKKFEMWAISHRGNLMHICEPFRSGAIRGLCSLVDGEIFNQVKKMSPDCGYILPQGRLSPLEITKWRKLKKQGFSVEKVFLSKVRSK